MEWALTVDNFKTIFNTAYIDPLYGELGFENPTTEEKEEAIMRLYYYFVAKYNNRYLLPEMQTTSEDNTKVIAYIKDIVNIRSHGLKYKYDMLAETMPESFDDFLDNYRMHKEYEKTKEYDPSTVANTGDDVTHSNVNLQTQEFTTTGDNAQARLKGETSKKTLPANDTDNDANSVRTTYGRTITSTPGDETTGFTQDAHGYYNSGSKAKMIEEIRKILSYNLIDQWLHDIIPTFCLDYYKSPSANPKMWEL